MRALLALRSVACVGGCVLCVVGGNGSGCWTLPGLQAIIFAPAVNMSVEVMFRVCLVLLAAACGALYVPIMVAHRAAANGRYVRSLPTCTQLA